MNSVTEIETRSGKIEAYKVSEHARMGTLPRHFGRHMTTVEGLIYDLMRQYSADYEGGLWHFFELSNGGFYMAPSGMSEPVRFSVETNGYAGRMSADAVGITVCLFCFSLLSFQYRATDVFAKHFHRLRDYAMNHVESTEIFAAID